MSIVTSTVPVPAALSSVILPDELLILPRQNDTPMWSASKVGYVWFGSIVYVAGAASAPLASALSAMPRRAGPSRVVVIGELRLGSAVRRTSTGQPAWRAAGGGQG